MLRHTVLEAYQEYGHLVPPLIETGGMRDIELPGQRIDKSDKHFHGLVCMIEYPLVVFLD